MALFQDRDYGYEPEQLRDLTLWMKIWCIVFECHDLILLFKFFDCLWIDSVKVYNHNYTRTWSHVVKTEITAYTWVFSATPTILSPLLTPPVTPLLYYCIILSLIYICSQFIKSDDFLVIIYSQYNQNQIELIFFKN